MWYFNCTIKAHSASEQHGKMAQGCCPWTPTRAYPPWTLRTRVLKKMTSQPTFLLHVLLQSIINLQWLFNLSNINTHFDISKIKACMGVIYFLICVRKHKSTLPTNIRTTAGEENTMIYRKMRPFEWNHIPGLFYDSVVCILLPKCVWFFPSEHYVPMFFV